MTMLHSMWQKLSGKLATAKTSALQASLSSANVLTLASVSSITKAAKETIPDKYQPLHQLLNQRQIIEVKVEGSASTYQTVVLAIDVQRDLLWLDDLFPNQYALELGDHITVRHHRNGEEMSFTSPVIAWGSDYGANGLAIMLPEQLSYTPRRQFSRARMSDKPSLSVKLRNIGQDISYGSILDISSGGLRASLAGNMLHQFRHGALLPLCEFRLSDELTIRCSARVCGFQLLRSPHRHTQVSIEFVDLSAERAQQLQQFINNLIYLQQVKDMPELLSA